MRFFFAFLATAGFIFLTHLFAFSVSSAQNESLTIFLALSAVIFFDAVNKRLR